MWQTNGGMNLLDSQHTVTRSFMHGSGGPSSVGRAEDETREAETHQWKVLATFNSGVTEASLPAVLEVTTFTSRWFASSAKNHTFHYGFQKVHSSQSLNYFVFPGRCWKQTEPGQQYCLHL